MVRIRRQLDLRGVVKIPILFRRNERQMRFGETYRKKEWLGLLRQSLESLHGDIRHHAVFVEIIRDIPCFESRTALSDFVLILDVRRDGFGVSGRFRRLPRHGPGLRIVIAGMVDLTHALNEVAVVLEMLRQRDDVRFGGAEVSDQIPDLRGIGPCSREEAGTGGRTNRLLHIGAIEDHAHFCDAVHVRTVDVVEPVAAQLRAQVVHGNKQNVRLAFPGALRG